MRKIAAVALMALMLLPACAPARASAPAHSAGAGIGAEAAQRVSEAGGRVHYGVVGLLAAFFIGAGLMLRQKMLLYGVKRAVAPSDDPAALIALDAAVAELLVRGAVSERGLSATILELVQRGALSASGGVYPPTGSAGTRLDVADRGADLTPQQRALMDWLFAQREFLWIEELNAGEGAQLAQAFAGGYDIWRRAVRQQAVDQRLYFGDGARLGCGAAMLAAGGALLSAALFFLGQGWMALAGLLLTGLLSAGFTRVRRMTGSGEARCAAARGFYEKYGEDASALPPEARAHLPILAALGAAEPFPMP